MIAYFMDTQTSPMPGLSATWARVDPSQGFKRGGPVTQHFITEQELIDVLGEVIIGPGGITIDIIEESTLKTGIPSSGIRPEDLAPYGNGPKFEERTIEIIKARMEAIRKNQTAAVMPQPPMPFWSPAPGESVE